MSVIERVCAEQQLSRYEFTDDERAAIAEAHGDEKAFSYWGNEAVRHGARAISNALTGSKYAPHSLAGQIYRLSEQHERNLQLFARAGFAKERRNSERRQSLDLLIAHTVENMELDGERSEALTGLASLRRVRHLDGSPTDSVSLDVRAAHAPPRHLSTTSATSAPNTPRRSVATVT